MHMIRVFCACYIILLFNVCVYVIINIIVCCKAHVYKGYKHKIPPKSEENLYFYTHIGHMPNSRGGFSPCKSYRMSKPYQLNQIFLRHNCYICK